jgi:hypothetical protein
MRSGPCPNVGALIQFRQEQESVVGGAGSVSEALERYARKSVLNNASFAVNCTFQHFKRSECVVYRLIEVGMVAVPESR